MQAKWVSCDVHKGGGAAAAALLLKKEVRWDASGAAQTHAKRMATRWQGC